ncbi:hypothetical protein ABZ371_08930 [Streptomyces sp. NPDC005899]|uniref:hypothetical protein n=1 Tax=Streptomyces sp. NPDC005899 TaxID=3155716 RepID=UPI0033CAE25B
MLPGLFYLLITLEAGVVLDDVGLQALTELTSRIHLMVRGVARLHRRLLDSRRPAHEVVEPGMTFITSGVAAAGIRATGSVASALIGRYRPTGIPRLGSKEDRAQAYGTAA